MGCSTCGRSAAMRAASSQALKLATSPSVQSVVDPNCPYTQEMLLNFKSKLIWFKDSGKYLTLNLTPGVLNRYIGLVLTSININNKCTYQTELNNIQDLVNTITLLQNG